MARVLVVDDTRSCGMALTKLIRVSDHECDYAPGGAEAIDHLKTAVPDLMILDLMMPDPDGYDVLRAVRDDPRTRSLNVVIYSAVWDIDVRALLLLGVASIWRKPWVPADIGAEVSRLAALSPEMTSNPRADWRTPESL